jgi:hypothetical protein
MDTINIIPITGFDGYFIDNRGSVYSEWSLFGRHHKVGSLRKMRLYNDRHGYVNVVLYKEGKRCQSLVHRLVAK